MPANGRPHEDQQDERWNGPEQVNKSGNQKAHGAEAGLHGKRYRETTEQAEGNDRDAHENRHTETAQDDRECPRHDLDVKELLDDRIHQARPQANRVSTQRPSNTTGMKSTT
jgi:hypothetical protein